METLYFLGIDISKKKFDAALTLDGKHFYEQEVENTAAAVQSFFKALKKQVSTLEKIVVCMEHTGIYCLPLLRFMSNKRIPVCVESALQIKKSQGICRGKSDKIDAKRIALYAMKNKDQLHFWKAQRKSIQMLEALLVTRERLVKMKTQLEVPVNESNDFVDSAVAREVAKNCQKTLQALQGDIRRIEHCIDTLIRKDSTLLEQVNLITSVPGVGKITALNMIVATAEFTRIQNAKKFACYAGVAPFEHTSGSSIRGRTRVSPMANVTCKKLLHLAALSAIRCCDELRIYYRRKVESGKNKMSVINAVRNKLIGRIFACIKERRRYQKILKISLHEP